LNEKKEFEKEQSKPKITQKEPEDKVLFPKGKFKKPFGIMNDREKKIKRI